MKEKILIYKLSGLEYYSKAATTLEAFMLTGADQGNISKCINGPLKTCGGFIFVRVPKNWDRDRVRELIVAYFDNRKQSVTQFVKKHY